MGGRVHHQCMVARRRSLMFAGDLARLGHTLGLTAKAMNLPRVAAALDFAASVAASSDDQAQSAGTVFTVYEAKPVFAVHSTRWLRMCQPGGGE